MADLGQARPPGVAVSHPGPLGPAASATNSSSTPSADVPGRPSVPPSTVPAQPFLYFLPCMPPVSYASALSAPSAHGVASAPTAPSPVPPSSAHSAIPPTLPFSSATYPPAFPTTPLAFPYSTGFGLPSGPQPPVPWSPHSTLPDVSVADHLPPVPAKLVSRIRGGAFIDFAELLPASLTRDASLTDPSLSRNLTPQAPRPRIRSFEDWLLGWAVFSSITLSAYPHRARDLLAYLTTILQAFRDFGGDRWLTYDRSFRRNAATRQLTDWSVRDLNLWSFAFTRPACRYCEFCEAEHGSSSSCVANPSSSSSSFTQSRPRPSEPQGTSSASEWCRSWNRGRCTSPRESCIYRHACWECDGQHRASSCPHRSQPFRDSASAPKRPRQGDFPPRS